MEKPNKEKDRPIISFKIDRNTLESFNSLISGIERTRAINNMIKYFIMPDNQKTARLIIEYDRF